MSFLKVITYLLFAILSTSQVVLADALPVPTLPQPNDKLVCGYSTNLPEVAIFPKILRSLSLSGVDEDSCGEVDFQEIPFLGELTDTSARVMAKTFASVKMRLGLWQARSFLYSIEMTQFNIDHNFKLNSLTPDTSYAVQLIGRTVSGRVVRSQIYYFRTQAATSDAKW